MFGLEPTFTFLIFAAAKKKSVACSSFALYFASFWTALDNYCFTLFAQLLFTLAPNHNVVLILDFDCLAVGRILAREDFAVFLLYFFFWEIFG